jgi:hypothetical protein
MGDRKGTYRVLVGRPEGNRPLERPKSRWEDNINTDFLEIGWENVDRIYLGHNKDKWLALVSEAMNLRVP